MCQISKPTSLDNLIKSYQDEDKTILLYGNKYYYTDFNH